MTQERMSAENACSETTVTLVLCNAFNGFRMCIEIVILLIGHRENAIICVSDADVNVICSRERAAKADPCKGAVPSKHRKKGLPLAPKK
jgi:hypothetical protein